MNSSETLAKAAFNRLKARLGKNFLSSLSETANFMKDAPEVIQKEWDLLKEEIIIEAERLDQLENKETSSQDISLNKEEVDDDQNTIDRIREKLSKLTNQLEEGN